MTGRHLPLDAARCVALVALIVIGASQAIRGQYPSGSITDAERRNPLPT